MDKRPDELGRDPLDRRDPLGEGSRRPDPLVGEPGFDPATGAFNPDVVDTDAFRQDVVDPDPLRAEETEVDQVEVTRVEIERTRAQMGETVDAIQERLSPENLKEQAKDRVKEATVGKAQEAGSGMMTTIKENPLPVALTGIGLGWLLANARKQSSGQPRYQDGAYAYPPAYDYPSPVGERETSDPSAGQALERTRDKVGETATQTQQRAGQVAARTRNRVGRLGEQARHQAQRAGGGFRRTLRENPLATGALAVGVGAAVGLAIPETDKEHEVMGEARDNLVEKAQEKAQEAQEKVQRVAQEAQSAAKDEADNQGLTDQ